VFSFLTAIQRIEASHRAGHEKPSSKQNSRGFDQAKAMVWHPTAALYRF
jgi:hypothetical protein